VDTILNQLEITVISEFDRVKNAAIQRGIGMLFPHSVLMHLVAACAVFHWSAG
jgi:hypothetical protein